MYRETSELTFRGISENGTFRTAKPLFSNNFYGAVGSKNLMGQIFNLLLSEYNKI